MNTATEFYEWLMQIEQDPSVPSCEVEFVEDDSQPSLACTVGSGSTLDGENSSLDTSLHSSSTCQTPDGAANSAKNQRQAIKRRVSFSNVEVREYAVTVGDHPFCFDGLPLTLDWEHTAHPTVFDIAVSRQRMDKYRLPRRLSYDERREKLFSVSDYSQDRVRDEEINMVINLLQQSWAQNHILPMPDISEIDEEDEDTKPPYEEVVEWERNTIKP